MASKDFTSTSGGIYVLKCPITLQVKYVGQTKNFGARKINHFTSGGKSLRLAAWFKSLEKLNLKPIFEIYLICDNQEIKNKVEKRLIISMNKWILNTRHGGLDCGDYIKNIKKRKDF